MTDIVTNVKIIEADAVVFKAPFIPKDIELLNHDTQKGLKYRSNIKLDEGKNIIFNDKWRIEHDDNKLYFYKEDVLKMSLE